MCKIKGDVDNSGKTIQTLSGQGASRPHLLLFFVFLLILGVERTMANDSVEITVDSTVAFQKIDGMGLSDGPGPQQMASMSRKRREKIYDCLFSDLKISIFRHRIHVMKDGTCFETEPGKYNINYDPVRLELLKAAKKRGVERFMACVWTPPLRMKTVSTPTGKGRLKKGFREAYCRYLAEYLIRFRTKAGIRFDWLSVQNEPTVMGVYGCRFSPRGLAEFTKYLQSYLSKRKVSVQLALSDGVGWAKTAQYLNPFRKTGDLPFSLVTTHDYKGVKGRTEVLTFVREKKLPLWLTEQCDHREIVPHYENGVKWACKVIEDFELGINAWFHWCFVALDTPKGQKGQKESSGLITVYPDKDKYTFPWRYFFLKHFYRNIRPGAVRIRATSNRQDVKVMGVRDADKNRLAVFIVNTGQTSMPVNLKFTQFQKGTVIENVTTERSKYATGRPVTFGSGDHRTVIAARSLLCCIVKKGSSK